MTEQQFHDRLDEALSVQYRDTSMPPNVLPSERALLGGILWHGLHVAHPLRTEDFYAERHRNLFRLIADLYDRRPHITHHDPIAVKDELFRVGRAMEATDMINMFDEAIHRGVSQQSARYHVERILETASARAGQMLAQRIAQVAGDPVASAEAIAKMQASAADYQARLGDDDALARSSLGELARLNRLAAATTPPAMSTGLIDLDRALNGGLRPATLNILGARPGVGKALSLDTPLPTPDGWTTMGDVAVGEFLIDANGKPTRVVAATDVMTDRPCFEVEFSDGSVIVADAEHQWLTSTRAARRIAGKPLPVNRLSRYSRDQRDQNAHPGVVTTEQIRASLRCLTSDGRPNHSVAVAAAAQFPERDLPVHPYLLGAWLGDGSSRTGQITSADPEVILAIEATGQPATKCAAKYLYGLHGLLVKLRALGVLNNKHIPNIYLRASEDQRRELLAGLLDTDGFASRSGGVQFGVTNERLARQAMELVLSLGYQATMRTKRVKGRTEASSIYYMVNFTPADKVFKLSRKAARQVVKTRSTTRHRYIVDVRSVDSVPVRCVQVDSADHLYLAGRTWIPTHNSLMAGTIAVHMGSTQQARVLYVTMELSAAEVTNRMLSNISGVDLTRLQNPDQLTDYDLIALDDADERLQDWPVHVIDGSRTIEQVEAAGRNFLGDVPAGLMIVDFLGRIREDGTANSRERHIALCASRLTDLSRELRVPILCVVSFNRDSVKRQTAPRMDDIRDSGNVESDADTVMLLWQPSPNDASRVECVIDKNRYGQVQNVDLMRQGNRGRLVNASHDGWAAA